MLFQLVGKLGFFIKLDIVLEHCLLICFLIDDLIQLFEPFDEVNFAHVYIGDH